MPSVRFTPTPFMCSRNRCKQKWRFGEISMNSILEPKIFYVINLKSDGILPDLSEGFEE